MQLVPRSVFRRSACLRDGGGTGAARSYCPRSLAGNPDSPQAIVFITSIIDIMVGFETYYIYYNAI